MLYARSVWLAFVGVMLLAALASAADTYEGSRSLLCHFPLQKSRAGWSSFHLRALQRC